MERLAVDGRRFAGETKTAEARVVLVAFPLPTADRQPPTANGMQALC